ncbi:hypothetical protein DPMN_067504 [Dreissena polymorpha]|uniref:Uncharacterized protein n=1 Tax=Dreissena polymorpha TaxID=45954 RepID=A0A9D4BSU9_DREPO|nr:hypothetical protein DPMN_067504 [Dreissena polymorpha]
MQHILHSQVIQRDTTSWRSCELKFILTIKTLLYPSMLVSRLMQYYFPKPSMFFPNLRLIKKLRRNSIREPVLTLIDGFLTGSLLKVSSQTRWTPHQGSVLSPLHLLV